MSINLSGEVGRAGAGGDGWQIVSAAFAAVLILVVSAGAARSQSFDPRSLTGLYGAETIDPGLLDGVSTRQVTRAYIPDAIDLSPMMPPPLQQIHGSCVSYAVGYALRGYYSALENGVEPGHVNYTPSPAFLHSRIRNRNNLCQDSGSHPFFAMAHFMREGAPDRETVPESAMCKGLAEQAGFPSQRFLIRSFQEVFEITRRRRRPNNRELDAIKQELAEGHPVATAFRLYEVPPNGEGRTGSDLQYLDGDEIYQGSRAPHGPVLGNHQMVFVGYDERRQAFLVQNSWGPYWAGDGLGWISYAAAKADMRNAYVMRTGLRPPRPVPGLHRTDRDNDVAVADDTCSKVYIGGRLTDGTPALSGFVSNADALAALAERFDPRMTRDIKVRPWPVCEVLKTLDAPLAEPSRPEIRMLGGETRLRYRDSLAFRIEAPDYASFLYIVYLQADGSVVNLLPRRGSLRNQAGIREQFIYGDGRQGRQKFTASPPAGAEAIVVIAARSPIAQLERLEAENGGQFKLPASDRQQGDAADDRFFLTALRAGMAERPEDRRLPREISAAVLHLTIEE